jgi:uncharacterized membrane protein YkgB
MTTPTTPSTPSTPSHADPAGTVTRVGRALALAGVVLPLILIGGMKFTAVEAEGIRPLVSGTPWLRWMYAVFGETGASRVIGTTEIAAALLLLAGPWAPRAGAAGATLGVLTFAATTSMLLVLPIWEPAAGGFPALGGLGQFLIKDVALLGICLVVLGERWARVKR